MEIELSLFWCCVLDLVSAATPFFSQKLTYQIEHLQEVCILFKLEIKLEATEKITHTHTHTQKKLYLNNRQMHKRS